MINCKNIIFNQNNIKYSNPLKNKICIKSFLKKSICNEIINKSEEHGQWTTDRHKHYPTTDIPMDKIPGLKKIKKIILKNIIIQTKINFSLEPESVIEPYDIFIVKYDLNGQNGLNIHRDSSELSFVLLLSDPKNFEGGGTYYKEQDLLINPSEQGTLVFHFGKTKHGGKNITKGIRYILIGFMNVKSKKILIPNKKDTKKFKNLKICDKRFYDFYWIGYDINPIKILVKIINLKHRKEKLKLILDKISKLSIPTNIIFDVKVHEANEGNKGEAYKNWSKFKDKIPNNLKKYYSREITKGEIGCFNSHIDIIKSCNDIDYLLILEDDASFDSDFVYRINQSITELNNKYWDAIDFGGVSIDDIKDNKITNSLVKKGNLFQAHCILYSSNGISKIKKINTDTHIIPFDDFLNTIRGIHFIDELNIYKNNFIMYNYYIQLSWQESNNIHDTESILNKIDIINEPQITINDNFDLINYYKWSGLNDTSLNKIKELCVKTNNNMWNFHICNVEGNHNPINITDWKLPIDNTKKLTLILILSDNSTLQLYQNNIKDIKVIQGDLYIFPSYIRFKCTNVAIFYANGNTFK